MQNDFFITFIVIEVMFIFVIIILNVYSLFNTVNAFIVKEENKRGLNTSLYFKS